MFFVWGVVVKEHGVNGFEVMWFFKLKSLGFRVWGDDGVHATLHSQGLKVFYLVGLRSLV